MEILSRQQINAWIQRGPTLDLLRTLRSNLQHVEISRELINQLSQHKQTQNIANLLHRLLRNSRIHYNEWEQEKIANKLKSALNNIDSKNRKEIERLIKEGVKYPLAAVSRSKLRRFYDVITTLREKLKYNGKNRSNDTEQIKSHLVKIIVIVSYDIARASEHEKLPLRSLRSLIEAAIEQTSSKEHVERFFSLMEAIIAFHAECAKDN